MKRLNELSQKTIKSYTHKAIEDSLNKSVQNWANPSLKTKHAMKNRRIGLNRAADRQWGKKEEEVEMPINELYKNKSTLIAKAKQHRADAWHQETLGDWHKPGTPERKKAAHKANRSLKASNIASKMAGHKFADEETVYESGGLSDTAHELVLHADNSSHLHNSSKKPIIDNLKKKMKKGVYDSEKAKKLWGYHADRAAHSYTKEHGHPGQKWHQAFSKDHRREAASHWEKVHRDELSEQVAIHDISKKLLELSKQTLKSYVKKSASSLRDAGHYGGWLSGKNYGDPSVRKLHLQAHKKAGKRQIGIERAASKLAKEDTINELKTKTLNSYIHKSAEDLEDAAGTETYAATKGRFEVADAMSKKATNRRIGIKRASNRLAAKAGN